MITPLQKHWLSALSLVMAADAIISIYGAWNYTSTFYEANPLFASFGHVETFTAAVIIFKVAAIAIVAYVVSLLNKEPGEDWADAAAAGSTCCFTALIGVMGIINLMV